MDSFYYTIEMESDVQISFTISKDSVKALDLIAKSGYMKRAALLRKITHDFINSKKSVKKSKKQ